MNPQPQDIVGKGWRFPVGVDGRGGVALANSDQDIEQAIEIILNTPKGMRLMRPQFGCRIHELIFAPLNSATMAAAARYVDEALAWWEPRIQLIEVSAGRDPNADECLLITISYRVRATHDERTLVYPFYSIPEES
jgi:phage baseplate assembly protein W